MALPTTRNTSYAPTDPVHSADLNDIQDQIIAIHDGRLGPRTIDVPLQDAIETDVSFNVIAPTNITKTFDLGVGTTGTGAFLAVPIRGLVPGMRILEAALYVLSKSSTGNLRTWLMRTAKTSPTPTQLSGDIIATGTGEVLMTSFSPAGPFVVLDDNTYFFFIEFPNEDVALTSLKVTIDKP